MFRSLSAGITSSLRRRGREIRSLSTRSEQPAPLTDSSPTMALSCASRPRGCLHAGIRRGRLFPRRTSRASRQFAKVSAAYAKQDVSDNQCVENECEGEGHQMKAYADRA